MFNLDDPVLVPVDVLAYMLGLTERRIQQLDVDLVFEKVEHGKYDLAESVRAYCEFLRNSERGSAVSKEEKGERVKLTRAKRKIAEYNQQELGGQLLRRDVVRKQLYQIARIQKMTFEAIPDRIAAIVAAESDRAACHKLLADEIREAQKNIVEDLESTMVEDPRAYVPTDLAI